MRTTRKILEAADRFITEILGDRRCIQNYYPPELTLAVLGPHARESIPISRFYQWVSPPVAVDFEPSPFDSPFYCDQKRKWAHEHGIVYMPSSCTTASPGSSSPSASTMSGTPWNSPSAR